MDFPLFKSGLKNLAAISSEDERMYIDLVDMMINEFKAMKKK